MFSDICESWHWALFHKEEYQAKSWLTFEYVTWGHNYDYDNNIAVLFLGMV